MSSPVRLRVHFAALGFGVDRLVKPMLAMRADVAIILTKSKQDQAKGFLRRCTDALEAKAVKVDVLECDIWRVSPVVNEVGAVVKSAPQHEYFFNVSTGSKTSCIAGTIAGMLWGVRPYYQGVNYAGKADERKEEFPISGAPQLIPTFETRGLEAADLRALEIISAKGGPIPKRDLLVELKKAGLIAPKRDTPGKEDMTSQAYYGQLSSILDRLDSWGFVQIAGRGRAAVVILTDAGREGATMFFHESRPSKPRESLRV